MDRRQPRGDRKHRIDRDAVIAAAREDLDNGALEDLSMRRLAGRLGVSPMALYRHVAGREDILDELVEEALRRHAAPPPPPRTRRGWRAWLVACNAQLRQVLLDQPVLLDRYLRAPVVVPAALERVEAVLGVLHRAGFTDPEAVEIYAAAHSFTLGFTALEAARGRSPGRPATFRPPASHGSGAGVTGGAGGPDGVGGADRPDAWPGYLGRLDPAGLPHLGRVRPDLARLTSPVGFDDAMTRLLSSWTPGSG